MSFLPPTTPVGPPAQTLRKQPLVPAGGAASLVAATPLGTPHRIPGGSKIEQTSSTPIIDISAIECQKENVQPLARGRSAHALSSTLTMQHKQRQAALNHQRSEFEQLVISADNQDSDDPLEAWTKYVKWCIDNFPSGQTHESGLVPLLERATRNFKDCEQYTNDSRYLRLWILYARNVECARDIYNFLLANEIGTKLASLYEELAVVNEGQNMFEEADNIYKLGIARRANPIDRLKRRYAEYQQRILLHPQATSAASGSAPQNYSEALRAAMSSCGRSVLGHKDSGSTGAARSNAANVLRGAGARIGAIGSSGTHSVVNNGRKLAVFQDDDQERGGARPSGPSSGGWDDVGTASSRSRENLQPDRLGSKALKIGASNGLPKKPSSGLAVFRDSDDDEDEEEDRPSGSAVVDKVLNPKDLFAKSESARAPTETDLLRRNPLMHWEPNTKFTPDPVDLDPVNALKVSRGEASRSGTSLKESKRDKAGASTSSSADKARKSSSGSKASSSRTAAGVSTSSSASKQERHACPLMLLYPGIASLDDAAKTRGGSNTPTTEVCLEELLVAQQGLENGSAAQDDPWAYLNELEGLWLPQAVSEEPDLVDGAVLEPDDGTVEHMAQSDGEVEEGQRTCALPEIDTQSLCQRASAEAVVVPLPRGEPRASAHESEPTSTMPSRDVFDPDDSFNNAVALNMQPKKKKSGKDATMKNRMSPTLVTKATMLEVENMFNGDDSETDSDDDCSEESSEEEDDIVAPLPPASSHRPRMMMPSSADIPPTPTPIGRHLSSAAIQASSAQEQSQPCDENAGARATPMRSSALTSRPPLGASTPMRAPMGNKVDGPGPASSSKPIYRDEDEDEDEDGDEDEDDHDYEPNMDNFRPQFQPLTPITEATYEMTRYTALSQASRTPATTSRNSTSPSWGRFELAEGLTIARETDGETGNLRSYEQMGKSFVIEDRDRTEARDLSSSQAERGEADKDQVLPADHETQQHLPLATSPQPVSLAASDFQPPNPCSPVDPEVLAILLARISPPVSTHAQFVDLGRQSARGRLASLQKRSKTEFRRSVGGSTYGSRASAKDWSLDIAGAKFQVLEKIGEGGYGAVFLAEDTENFAPSARKQLMGIDGAEDLDSSFTASLADLSLSADEDEEERRRMLAVKAESPPNPWEFYVLDKLRKTVEPHTQSSIVSARKFVGYSDESFLLLEYGEKGTLLEVVNQAASAGVATMGSAGSSAGGVEEVLAMFFTIELLKVVEAMHRHQMIHGDLKIDNCLLRLDEAPVGTTWSNAYTADGSSGWAQKGLTLIDFGRAIDLSLYPPSQTFIADWTPDSRDCAQMREARPFTYQPDYHGVASVAFCLLFGRYIETTNILGEDGEKRWKITAGLRRYWQVELWNRLFDLMLNPPMVDGQPILEEMKDCREEMQLWLEANCNRGGKNLKGLIRKLEIWAMKRAS